MDNKQIIKYDNGQLIKVGNAIAVTNKLLALGENLDAEFYFQRGLSKSKLNDRLGAIEDYTKAIQINHQYTDAYYNRGFSKAILNDDAGAIEDYSKVIEINPRNAVDAYNNRGFAKDSLNDYLGAIEDYTKAIEIYPEYGDAHYNRGISKKNLNDFVGAIDDFTRAIAIERKIDSVTDLMLDAYLERAKAKAAIGDEEGSRRDYIIINLRNSALRIRKDGLNEDEKRLFGIQGKRI